MVAWCHPWCVRLWHAKILDSGVFKMLSLDLWLKIGKRLCHQWDNCFGNCPTLKMKKSCCFRASLAHACLQSLMSSCGSGLQTNMAVSTNLFNNLKISTSSFVKPFWLEMTFNLSDNRWKVLKLSLWLNLCVNTYKP